MGGAASSARNVERFKIVDSDENASVTVAELKALLSAEWTEERITKLIAVFDDDGNGELNDSEWKRACALLRELAENVGGHIDAKEDQAAHGVDESNLPPGLQGFTPVSKQARVQKETTACAALEEAVSKDPASAAAKASLRTHIEDNLQPAITAAIDEKLKTEGILKTCDQAIAAGVDCDHVYTSVFDMVKSGEAKGLQQLVKEVGKIERARREGGECKQNTADAVALFADAARVRPMARGAMEAVAAKAKGSRLEKQGPLKKMGRIVEKISLRPGDGRGRADRVCDIVRDMFVAESLEAVAGLVRLLREESEIEIVRVKDRFTTPSAGGWRDLMINYKLRRDAAGHCCEVQICHNSLLVARKGLPGHAIYGRVRNANELLERLGMLDKENRLIVKMAKKAGFSCADAKRAGLTVMELPQAYSKEEIISMLSELKQGGMTFNEAQDQGYSGQEIKAAGYSLQEFNQAQSSPEQIRAAGFSSSEMLKAAGLDDLAKQLKAAGLDAATEQLLTKTRSPSLAMVLSQRDLRWSNKNLDADDAKVVAFVVANSHVLTQLDISGNKLSAADTPAAVGALAIANALRVNAPLKKLIVPVALKQHFVAPCQAKGVELTSSSGKPLGGGMYLLSAS